MQTTSSILMIRPVNFRFNAETAVNNAFQVPGQDEAAQQYALKEFDNFVRILRAEGVEVTVVNDTADQHTPDSIFPNNWISFHDDGTICLYPMFAHNRRLERKPAVIEKISHDFKVINRIDLTGFEHQGIFLEGTGSMVLDRDEKIAYACLSPRTDIRALEKFCELMRYRPVSFHATDSNGGAIYHTNVMMCVGDDFIVAAMDSIKDDRERQQLVRASSKRIIPISLEQMNEFAGNMLLVNNTAGEKLLVMSTRAFESLTTSQIRELTKNARIVHAPLTTIENNGGGSARCMMAEIHLMRIES